MCNAHSSGRELQDYYVASDLGWGRKQGSWAVYNATITLLPSSFRQGLGNTWQRSGLFPWNLPFPGGWSQLFPPPL